jgi:Na+-driven multidrug efflux pump
MDAALPHANAAPGAALKRLRPIFALGTPLVGWFLIYNVMSIVAVAVLGQLGNAAIAGVGVASAIYAAISALLNGVDTGVQAIVSRSTGAGRTGRIADVLAAAHAGGIPAALVIGAATWRFGPSLVALILPDHAAAAAGGAWIQAAAPSIVFLAVTLPINAAWIGSGRPAIAMAVTALSAPLQITADVRVRARSWAAPRHWGAGLGARDGGDDAGLRVRAARPGLPARARLPARPPTCARRRRDRRHRLAD